MNNDDRLESVSIKNIKGIISEYFKLALCPNKPCIFVAPNGFGKSSIACAFASLNKNRIDLHKRDQTKDPAISSPSSNIAIRLGSMDYKATDSSNTISTKFDYFVINSRIRAKVQKTPNPDATSAVIKIEKVILIGTIPERKSSKYNDFLEEERNITDLLEKMDSSKYKIKIERQKNGKKKQLVAKFPDAAHISNGQRDILCFIAKILQIRRKLNKSKKEYCLLIIDEIFDYLDDANLAAFQYFIVQFISESKKNGKKLYPILLTHLDPVHFKHSFFSNHKLQIRYFAEGPAAKSKLIVLVKNRENSAIKDLIDKYLFHYHPDDKNIENKLKALPLGKIGNSSHSFYHLIKNEMEKYLADEKHDPICVLLALRIKIEESARNKLSNCADKCEFLDIHGTTKKLEFCEGKKIEISETCYLLGVIYNEELHPRDMHERGDYLKFLNSKLSNPTIKKMIREIWNQ